MLPRVQGWAYLSLLTDAGSRAIVGYALCKTLEAEGPLKALRMAMDFYNRYNVDLSSLIHHSDRGVQYCSKLVCGHAQETSYQY